MDRRTFINTSIATATAAALPKWARAAANPLAAPRIGPSGNLGDSWYPSITGLPSLPAIKWSAIGATAPTLVTSKSNYLSPVDVVVICWAEAEWAPIEHVFVSSSSSMAYSAASTSSWSGWDKYTYDLPSGVSGWTYWGYYRIVEVNGKTVMLFKSNTHLDFPGAADLTKLIQMIVKYCKPSLIISTGTAGGSRLTDKIGTINVVNAATMYSSSEPSSSWPTYTTSYVPTWGVVEQSGFSSLLVPIPATSANLSTLASQFNSHYGTSYSISTLNADSLCTPSALPALNNLVPNGTSLLTASTFVTGNTSADYANYAVIEMDDAVIAQVCQASNVPYLSVRNVSDPAQNASLPASVQGNWGSAVYDVFGFYTSYNGALVAWAVIQGMAA
jgi:nucleoside phosphorylase